MGQTLEHGIYLPDEGERNCYSGLAGNWQILDNSVGTIAEHTSALAGKASLVHTHTKSDITDFPAYGTTAGTICEGNDSRLSDARTPVAHTHTKSDVTDLLNSNFIPSANNSYDLGSSSYQWNNLYAKNYYYNGTAWGLDQANTWTASQTLSSNSFLTVRGYRFRIKNDSMILGTVPSSNQWTGMQFTDKNDNSISEIVQSFQSNGNSLYQINVFSNEANSEKRSVIAYAYNSTNNTNNVTLSSNLVPNSNNTYGIGTSSNKWKSFNGVNPGALSLPNLDSDGYIDLSDHISANSEYLYTPVYDGWLALYCQTTGFHAENAVGIFNMEENTNSYRWSNTITSSINLLRLGRYHGSVILPVRAGIQYGCWVVVNSSTPLASARLFFYKAKGNV